MQYTGSLVMLGLLSNCRAQAPEHVDPVAAARELGFPHLPGMWDLSSLTRDQNYVHCTGRWILNHWTIREVPTHALF